MTRCAAFAVLLAAAPGPLPGQSSAAPVVIYLHGRIVEDQGPAALSPEFGSYAFHDIVDSLGAGGVRVIADLRPPNTDMDREAARVVRQVDSLLQAGVPPARIAVIGFSKGGGIAMRASARLGRTDVAFVFLASCGEGPAALEVAGRILSVFEASDALGRSCAGLFARARAGTTHAERRIETGLGHGAFYRPLSAWVEPVRVWIRGGPLPDG